MPTRKFIPTYFWVQFPVGILQGAIEVVFAIALVRISASAGWIHWESTGSALDAFFSAQPLRIFLALGVLKILTTGGSSFLTSVGFEAFRKNIRDHLVADLRTNGGRSAYSVSQFTYIQGPLAEGSSAFLAAFSRVVGVSLSMTATLVGMLRLSPLRAMQSLAAFAIVVLPLILFRRRLQALAARMHGASSLFARRASLAFRNQEFLHLAGRAEAEALDLAHVSGQVYRASVSHNLWSGTTQRLPELVGVAVIAYLLFHLPPPAKGGMEFLYLIFQSATLGGIVVARLASCWIYYPFFKEFSALVENRRPAIEPTRDVAESSDTAPTLELRALRVGRESALGAETSLTVGAGQMLCLSGASGAGKTTFLQTLLGVLPPFSGEVLWNGQARTVRSRVAFVSSEPFLLDMSVDENLRYGLPPDAASPSREDLWRALSLTEAESFVSSHPEGLERRLNEGGLGLSSGQKQRIALARALLSKPRILILDEATANLDVDLEERVIKRIRAAHPEMMILASSHRTSLSALSELNVRISAECS